MRKGLVSLTLVLAIVGLLAAASPGNAIPTSGPACFSTAPFADVLVWFFDFNGMTASWFYFDATGRDIAGNRPQSVSVFVDAAGTTLHVGYTTYPKPGFVPVIAGGTIDLATLSGPGQCFAPDLTSCGAFTFQLIACPAGALPESSGRLQGQQE